MQSTYSNLLLALIAFTTSCATSSHPPSRNPIPYNFIPKSHKVSEIPSPKKQKKENSLYIKSQSKVIRLKPDFNSHGSLINLQNPKSYFYLTKPPLGVGDYVQVTLLHEAAESSSDAKEKSQDEATDSTIMMEIGHLHPNGDAELIYSRDSVSKKEESRQIVKGKVASEDLKSQNKISSDKLFSVSLMESNGGEITQRSSSSWEKDYTQRILDFREAQTEKELSVSEQRKRLAKKKETLDKALKDLGKERKKMATERDKLLAEKSEQGKEIQELKTQVEELKAKVSETENSEENPEQGQEGAEGEQ